MEFLASITYTPANKCICRLTLLLATIHPEAQTVVLIHNVLFQYDLSLLSNFLPMLRKTDCEQLIVQDYHSLVCKQLSKQFPV